MIRHSQIMPRHPPEHTKSDPYPSRSEAPMERGAPRLFQAAGRASRSSSSRRSKSRSRRNDEAHENQNSNHHIRLPYSRQRPSPRIRSLLISTSSPAIGAGIFLEDAETKPVSNNGFFLVRVPGLILPGLFDASVGMQVELSKAPEVEYAILSYARFSITDHVSAGANVRLWRGGEGRTESALRVTPVVSFRLLTVADRVPLFLEAEFLDDPKPCEGGLDHHLGDKMKAKIGSREGVEKLRFWLKFLLVCGAVSLLADIFVACTEVTQTVGPIDRNEYGRDAIRRRRPRSPQLRSVPSRRRPVERSPLSRAATYGGGRGHSPHQGGRHRRIRAWKSTAKRSLRAWLTRPS